MEWVKNMFDVLALGELLIDFSLSGKFDNGNILFESNPGGTPANVLATVSRLGINTAFIGKVGNDQFGKFLAKTLKDININTDGLVFANEFNTALASIHLNELGDRSFNFYRNLSADMMLREDEVNFDRIKNTRVFHFGSVSMTHGPVRSVTLKAACFAKENQVLVSYDPNLRPQL